MSNNNNIPKEILKESLDNRNIKNELKLNENLSTLGKLFFTTIASFIANKNVNGNFPFKIKGDPEKVRSLIDVIVASKEFQSEISKPGAKVEDIVRKMNLKNDSKAKFEEIIGSRFPL